MGLYVGSREIKDVCECIDESVFSYCVYATGANRLPNSEDASDENGRGLRANFLLILF